MFALITVGVYVCSGVVCVLAMDCRWFLWCLWFVWSVCNPESAYCELGDDKDKKSVKTPSAREPSATQ